YISLLFFFNIIILFSQSTDTPHGPAVDSKIITNSAIPQNLLSSNIKILETYDNVQGSPYISNYAGVGKNIPLGKVYDQQMKLIGTAFIIYNAYTDEMEISAIEDSINFYRFKKQSNSYYIKLYNKLYRAYVSDYQLNYFVILSANDRQKCTLLRKEKVLFIKSNEQTVSLVKEEPSSFRRIKDSYYLKINDLVYKIPSGKKNFYTLFKEKSALIKSYVKQNNLKISSEEDLRSIVDYFNTIK
ncbi:MAG: hypothetical protein HKN90_08490, partial [Flavobacteriaceae bacterium]|nr:hypothetical protein [Flavobacteriaceae bacterium]